MATDTPVSAPTAAEAVSEPFAPEAWVYLLCFAHNPYKHARHYLGMTTMGVAARIAIHRGESSEGTPAKLLTALREAGGSFVVADVWDCLTKKDAYQLEHQLKGIGNGGRLCSICSPGNRRGTGLVGRRRKEVSPCDPR